MNNMSHDEWVSAVSPKVDGTWNLHNAVEGHPLDFFFLASSTIAVVNQAGQGNYSGANTFLEAFCQYRHSLGLPASVLNICPIEDTGFVAENADQRKSLKTRGHYFLQEQDFIDFLQLSLLNSRPATNTSLEKSSDQVDTKLSSWENTSQIIMGLRSDVHPEDPNNRTHWRRDRRMGIYHNFRNTDKITQSTAEDQLKDLLLRCAEDPSLLDEIESVSLLTHEINMKIFSLVLKDVEEIDAEMTLLAVGVDSLIAVELRRWLKWALGLDINVLEIMSLGTVKELDRVVVERLRVKFGGGGS